MVCKTLSTEKLGVKIILKQKILPNDQHFISTFSFIKNHRNNALNPSTRLLTKSQPIF